MKQEGAQRALARGDEGEAREMLRRLEVQSAERERLAEQIKGGPANVEELGHHVLTDVRKFVGDFAQSDDMCVTCVSRA